MNTSQGYKPIPKPQAKKKLIDEVANNSMKEALNSNAAQTYTSFTSIFPHLHEESPVLLTKLNVSNEVESENLIVHNSMFNLEYEEEMHLEINKTEELEEIQAITTTKVTGERPKTAIKIHNLVDEPDEDEEEVFYTPSFVKSETKDELPIEEGTWEEAPNVPINYPQLSKLESTIPEEDDIIEIPKNSIVVSEPIDENSFETPLEDFSLDPEFDYENLELTPKMSMEELKKMWDAGELKDWV